VKNQIPQLLLNKLHEKRSYTDKFPTEIKQFLTNYSNFYNWGLNDDYKNIWKLIKQNVSTLPICGLDSCDKPCMIKITKDICVVQKGCCPSHHRRVNNLEKYGVEYTLQVKSIRDKIIETNKERYGSSTPLSNSSVRQKAEKTMLERYGVTNPMMLDVIVEKCKQTKYEKYGSKNYNNLKQMKKTMLERYGDYNPMRLEKFKNKATNTCLEKYGTSYHIISDFSRDKIKETNIKKYGVDNVFKSSKIRDKIKKTLLNNYGVEYPIQNPLIYDKMVKTSYKYVNYVWKTGEISKVQGYEPIVLKELENAGYSYKSVLTSTKDMPEIWYEFDNKKHRYYPDFYIPEENLIIEVKSKWTLQLHLKKNKAKFKAVKDLGFNFRLEVR